jgi:hypothetical protein
MHLWIVLCFGHPGGAKLPERKKQVHARFEQLTSNEVGEQDQCAVFLHVKCPAAASITGVLLSVCLQHSLP